MISQTGLLEQKRLVMRSHQKTKRFHCEHLENRRLLSFSVGGDYAISGYANSVAVGNFNNDARADFAVSTGSPDGIRVMLGNANGTFTAGTQVSALPAGSLAAADVTGDGKLDLLATEGSLAVQYFVGNGNGTFQSRQVVTIPPPPNPPSTFNNRYYPNGITVADVTADGKADLVAGCIYEYIDPEWDPNSPYPPQIFYGHYLSVLRGNGNATFTTAFVHEITSGNVVNDVEARDLNGDGKLDLVLGSNWLLDVMLGVGNGTFSAGPSYFWPNTMIGGDAVLALADFNADGKIDVAAAGDSVNVGFGDGSGGFAPPVTYDSGPTFSRSLATADFNLDGRPDLVAGNFGTPNPGYPGYSDGKISVLLNNGGGGFLAPLLFACGPTSNYGEPIVAAADFNGDGRRDIAASSYYLRLSPDPSLANIRLLINDGNFLTKTWIGPASGGNWSTAGNWSPSGVPGATDHVFISAAGVQLSATVIVAGLNLTGGAKLDLKDNNLVINYTGVSPIGSWNGSAYTGITGMLQSGRNGGAWNGSGIVTSMSNVGDGTTRTLGVNEASAVLGLSGNATANWNGVTVDATAVIVKYTYAGDIDLNGELNGDDYFYIDSHVLQSGSVFGYDVGDIDLNGVIDGDDYFWIDSNITAQGGPL
jgi:hypothetical protein